MHGSALVGWYLGRLWASSVQCSLHGRRRYLVVLRRGDGKELIVNLPVIACRLSRQLVGVNKQALAPARG